MYKINFVLLTSYSVHSISVMAAALSSKQTRRQFIKTQQVSEFLGRRFPCGNLRLLLAFPSFTDRKGLPAQVLIEGGGVFVHFLAVKGKGRGLNRNILSLVFWFFEIISNGAALF